MGAIPMKYTALFAFYLILLIPLALSSYYKLKLGKTLIISVMRMTIQLFLVGLYLEWIFHLNHWWLNLLWVFVMITTAAGSAVRRAQLRLKYFFFPALTGIILGIFGTGAILITTISPDPFYDASYVIPITGMLLGNSMRSIILALERFYYSIKNREKDYLTYLLLGANRNEALLPFLRESLLPALGPTISTMATLGIVSLPGMMTGQILGGSPPATAIQYQMAIMIAILVAVSVSTLTSIKISQKMAFNSYHILREDIFRKD